MKIRKKLTYQFIAIVACILIFFSLTIYISFSRTRKADFYDRLGSKATMVAQMLIEFEEIDADLLRRIETNNPLSLPNEKIVIYNFQNEVIYSSDEEQVLRFSERNIHEVRLNGEVHLKQAPYEIIGQFYTSEYDRLVVFAAATDIFGVRKLKRLRIIILLVFLFSSIIGYFTGRVFVTRAIRPISDISSQAEAIGIVNLHERISVGTGEDEIAQLAQTFNRVLDRLELAFMNQKSFIANASHELRTPLTVITGQLEVILLKERSKEEYRKTILSLLEDIKNLNQISNRLLLLAQASSEFPESGFGPVRIDDSIWQARKEVLQRNQQSHIQVYFAEDIDSESKLTVTGIESLLKTALVNLMDNGCKYSADHLVEIYFTSKEGEVRIRFSDKGIGIPDEEISLITQPFYRAKNVVGIRGHGIGLSLVERIISLHEGTISIASELGVGTDITIALPSMEKKA